MVSLLGEKVIYYEGQKIKKVVLKHYYIITLKQVIVNNKKVMKN